MDEEALKDAHKLFLETGYKGDLAKFKNLISTNPDALKDAHKLFVNTGYNKSIDDFSTLVGVKKKVPSTSISITPNQKLVSEKKVGSSGIVKQDNSKKLDELFAKTSQNPKSNKSEEIAYQKILKNKPLVNKPIKEVNREDIAVPTKKDRQITQESKVFEREQKMKDAKIVNEQLADYETKRLLSKEESDLELQKGEDEISGTGFINNVSDYGKKAWNAVAPVLGMAFNQSVLSRASFETDVLAEDKEEFVSDLKKQGKNVSSLTSDEIYKGAKELFLKKKLNKAQEDKETLLIESLPEDVKKKIEIQKDLEYGTLKDKDLLYTVRAESSKKRIEDLNKTISAILEKNKRNETLTPEEIDFAKNYETKAKEEQSNWEKNQSDYYNNSKQLLTVEQEHKMLKKSYEDGYNLINKFLLNSARVGLGFAQFEEKVSSSVFGDSEKSVEYRNNLAQWQADIDKIKETEFADQTEGLNSVHDTFKFVSNVVGEQLPNMLMMSLSGGASIPLIGASSAGNKFGQLQQSNNEGKTNFTPAQILANGFVTGLANMLETQTLKSLTQFNRIIKAGTSNPETRQLLKDSYKETSKKILKGIGGEEFEELGSFFIEDTADQIFLGIKKTNAEKSKQIKRLLTDTAVFGTFMQGMPHIISSVTKPFASKSYIENLDKHTKEVVRLTKELQNENLSESDRQIIQTSLDKVTKQSSDLINGFIKNTVNLSDESKDRVIELENKSSNARVKAEEINKSKTISKETKQALLNDLKTEYVKSEELRNNIIDGKTNILDVVSENKKEEMKSNALNVLLSETEGSNEAQFTNDVIEQKAIELYNNQIQSKDAKTEIPITETKSQAEVQKPTDAKQEIQEVVEKQKEGDSVIDASLSVGDNADLQQREQQPKIIEVQSTTDVGESKPNVKRVKSLKDAEYDVSFDEKGEVTKINSVKDGREIPKFSERVNPKTGKTTLVKNANYARIEADSKGEQLDSRIKSDDKKVFEEAVLNFEPNTEYDLALNALANGAKVSMESLQKELGNTDQKWATNQSKSEQLPSIEKLSEQIWEESGGQLDQMEIRNQLIDIIQTNPNVDSLKSKLIEVHNSRQSQKQEDELRAYLGNLSEKDLANYESIKAEDDYISELSDEEATQYYEQEYLKSIGQTKTENDEKQDTDKVGEAKTTSVQKRDGETTERKEEPKEVKSKNDFEVSASIVPNGEVGEYLSGKTIEKYTGEKPQNNQEILKVKLEEALLHGISTIDKAKEQFGDEFVSKVLEYLDTANISPEAKALTYVSLENEIVKSKKDGFEDDLTIQKKLDLVREKRQAFARSNSLALNMNRLQKFSEAGFNIENLTDKFFSEKTKEAKKSIEETIQVKSGDVNKQDDAEQSGEITDDLKALIQEGIDKEINEIYKKLPAGRKARAEKAITALEKIQKNLRKNTYDATIGVPIAIIDGGITVIKNAIKAGVSIADAIELGIDNIKNKYNKDWKKESQFRKDMSEAFKSENIDLKEKSKADESTKGIVKQALIDAGYSREVTFNGEKVKRLDWVKLAGEEGSVDNIKSKVEEVLQKDGYSKKQIEEMKISLEEEYNRLSAEIIQKGLNELEKRNLIKPSPNRKSESKRLAELYNMGLLDKNENEYDNLLNKVLGLSEFEQNIFNKIKAKTKALSDIYNAEVNGKKITEHSLQTVANDLNHEIKELLNAVSYKEGDFKYKLITLLTDYAGLSQKALLGGLPNLIENVTSGRFAGLEQKLYTDKFLTPELRKQIKKDKKVIYNDITKNAGLYYGDTNTSLVSSSRFEDWVNGKTDNRVAHAVISAITLRSWLDGADSRSKVGLSSKLFIKNAVEILTSKSNPNGAMKREDAIKFVSESLTGDKFSEALETSKAIIDEVNNKQDKKQLKDTPEAIHRFAMNLVKENLMQDNRMTMEQIEIAFKSGYKSAGRDIGHEANNPISRSVNMLNASLTAELEKAVSEKRYSEATALSAKMMVLRTIINPFVGGGTNWVILGLEKSGNPLGYISTLFNATKKKELDLGTVSGIKNMSEALYRKNNYQASLTRNIIGTSVALALFVGMNIDIDDEEDAKDKLNKWLKENKWAKRYFEKLSPEALVFMISLENKELGKHLAKNLGINGDTFNNTSKLLKSLDKETTSTSGKAGQVVGSPLNSPLAWKTVKDIQNVVRGLKGLEEIKTDYKATGFWNGYFQGGLVEFVGMRPNKENTAEKPKEKSKYSKF